MPKQNQNRQHAYSVSQNAARLREERQISMSNTAVLAARRVSQQNAPHLRASPTPSKRTMTASGNPQLSHAIRDHWNVPHEHYAKPKATLQDVNAAGQTLRRHGVTTNEVVSPSAKQQIENSFDTHHRTGSSSAQNKSLSRMDKAASQAKQSVPKQSRSQSSGWER